MDYAAESYDGPVLLGDRNPTPMHFHHIATWQEYGPQGRLTRINNNRRAMVRNHKRNRF